MASLSQGYVRRSVDRSHEARVGSMRWERRRVADFRIVDDHQAQPAVPLPDEYTEVAPPAANPNADKSEHAHLVREFTQLSMSGECGCDGLCRFVGDHRERYPDLPHVVDDLLVPAVRMLGQMWCDDDADFVTVTLASHRISLTLMRLEDGTGLDAADADAAETVAAAGGRGPVMLINAPDDQHGFGLLVIGFHLRRAGWQVEMAENPAALFRQIQQRRYAAVGISAAHDSSLAGAGRLIADLRRRAPAGGLRIALGGASVTNGDASEVGRAADLSTDDPAAFLAWLDRSEAADNEQVEVDAQAYLPQAD